VLAPQVDELLLIANPVPDSVPADVPPNVRVLRNERALSFAANANVGTANTAHELVLIANPDAVPGPDAVPILRRFMVEHAPCGRGGPRPGSGVSSWRSVRARPPRPR